MDWPCFYFVSPDSGQNWSYLLPGKEELRQLVMESGARLPDGTQIYFDRRKVMLDGPERERIRITREAMRKGMKFKGVLAGELPEELQWTPMYVRKPGEQEWTQRQSYLPPALRLPVIRVVDREKLTGNVTDELIRELFEKLEHGDPSVPYLEQIELGTVGNAIDVLPDGSWITVLNYADHDLPRIKGDYADNATAGERPLAAVLRSEDQGEHWTVWRSPSVPMVEGNIGAMT